MKYFLSLLAVLALVGAGCATDSASEKTSAEVTSDTELVVGQDVSEPSSVDSDDSDPTTRTVNPEIITEDLVSEATTDENGVPVFELVLGAQADVEVEMEAGNFFFDTKEIKASPGDRISITFAKSSGFHTFVIDELNLNFTVTEGEVLNFTAPSEPGSYPIYCDIGSHRAFGMEGMLIVE
ncbi:MAG: cupredoxin domain-containing protein [Patescibacteria group bacterium]